LGKKSKSRGKYKRKAKESIDNDKYDEPEERDEATLDSGSQNRIPKNNQISKYPTKKRSRNNKENEQVQQSYETTNKNTSPRTPKSILRPETRQPDSATRVQFDDLTKNSLLDS